jgi:hypothetical protein
MDPGLLLDGLPGQPARHQSPHPASTHTPQMVKPLSQLATVTNSPTPRQPRAEVEVEESTSPHPETLHKRLDGQPLVPLHWHFSVLLQPSKSILNDSRMFTNFGDIRVWRGRRHVQLHCSNDLRNVKDNTNSCYQSAFHEILIHCRHFLGSGVITLHDNRFGERKEYIHKSCQVQVHNEIESL